MNRWFKAGGVLLFAGAVAGVTLRLNAEEDLGPLDAGTTSLLAARAISGYEGTPLPVVRKMLELAKVRAGDTVYDLGSGDGRILILAAQKFGARGVGIELDPRLVRRSRERIRRAGLSQQIQIIEGDVLESEIGGADVVTMAMPPYGAFKLRPRLEKLLRPGTRVVACVGDIPEWKPASVTRAQADDGKTYDLKLYVMSRRRDETPISNLVTPN